MAIDVNLFVWYQSMRSNLLALLLASRIVAGSSSPRKPFRIIPPTTTLIWYNSVLKSTTLSENDWYVVNMEGSWLKTDHQLLSPTTYCYKILPNTPKYSQILLALVANRNCLLCSPTQIETPWRRQHCFCSTPWRRQHFFSVVDIE